MKYWVTSPGPGMQLNIGISDDNRSPALAKYRTG